MRQQGFRLPVQDLPELVLDRLNQMPMSVRHQVSLPLTPIGANGGGGSSTSTSGGVTQQSPTTQAQNTTTIGGANTKANTSSTGNTASQGNTANTYSPFQQELQQEAAGQAGQFLATGIAPGVQQELDAQKAAYMQNFNESVAPQLAAQYGAGSPAIGSQLAQGLVSLTSDVYQNQAGQFNSALGTAGNLAYNATGASSNTNQQQAANTASKTSSNDWQNQTNLLANSGSTVAGLSNTTGSYGYGGWSI